jgi:hypothetical protein
MLNYLQFKTLYFGRINLDALFVTKIFKNKIHSCSLMDAAGLRVPTKQILDFTFNVSNV